MIGKNIEWQIWTPIKSNSKTYYGTVLDKIITGGNTEYLVQERDTDDIRLISPHFITKVEQ